MHGGPAGPLAYVVHTLKEMALHMYQEVLKDSSWGTTGVQATPNCLQAKGQEALVLLGLGGMARKSSN